jgi:hypothetical protein
MDPTLSNKPSKTKTLNKPQKEFLQHFLGPDQLQRLLIYFSKQSPGTPQSSHSFTDVVVRLINDPLNIVFGQHGVYLFSNHLLVFPYNELDEKQVAYITNFLRMHVPALAPFSTEHVSFPSMRIDARVSKQMGGGYTVRPVQLTNIRINTLDVLFALVRGIVIGQPNAKYSPKYRQHAVNLQLQKIVTKVVVSRAQLQAVNVELERCQGLV